MCCAHCNIQCTTSHLLTNFLLDADWGKRWISSTKKGSDAGKFVLSAGKFYNDPEQDKGTKL